MAHKLHARLCAGQGELESIARDILDCNRPIIILSGEVGSGKTTLTQALLICLRARESTAKPSTQSHRESNAQSSPESLSLDSSASATSPTFSLMHDYGGMYHYDLYRRTSEEVLQLGLLDWLGEEGLHCIEWGENLVDMLLESGFSCMVVKILTPEFCSPESSLDSGESRIYELYL